MAYGKRLLQDRKDIGDAFARAYIRTVNTYYQGDYHKDPKVMAEIQKFTGQTDAVFGPLAALDSLTMDWEMRKDTTTRVRGGCFTPNFKWLAVCEVTQAEEVQCFSTLTGRRIDKKGDFRAFRNKFA